MRLCQAAELLELVSPKISEEQLQRKLDYKVAQEYDDEVACLVGCCWMLLGFLCHCFKSWSLAKACERLASVYQSSGRTAAQIWPMFV